MNEVDTYICAEMPPDNHPLRDVVQRFMSHGHTSDVCGGTKRAHMVFLMR